MKYSLWQNIKYLSNYSRTVVHLQRDVNHLSDAIEIAPFCVREANLNDENDIIQWIGIINDGYDDVQYDIDSAKSFIVNHNLLNISKVYFFMDGNNPAATVSIGTYKEKPNIGGAARLAVKNEYQGRGLGKLIFLYGLSQLNKMKIQNVETVISIPRRTSIFLHFKCGFLPQFNSKYFVFKGQRRFWIVKWIVHFKLWNYYRKYKVGLFENFIN